MSGTTSSGAQDGRVTVEHAGGIAHVTLDRPDKLNALNVGMFMGLIAAMEEVTASPTARVCILHGSGRAFAAGADIDLYQGTPSQEIRRFMDLGRRALDAVATCPKPVIAAVHGYALGGGFELAIACDLIVAAESTRLGLPEVTLGLLPGGGGTQRLPRLVGRLRANDLLMTGRSLTAAEALEWGLVNRVAPDGGVVDAAVNLAEVIARRAPLAVGMGKRLVQEGLEQPLAVALVHERESTLHLYETEDAKEGIDAFVEKRKPSFHGQ